VYNFTCLEVTWNKCCTTSCYCWNCRCSAA